MNEDQELLNKLHSALIANLYEKIKNGEATAGDLGVARQFLKDNGVDVSAKYSEPILRLNDILPFSQEDDLEEECA